MQERLATIQNARILFRGKIETEEIRVSTEVKGKRHNLKIEFVLFFLGGFHHSVLSYDIILQRGQKFMSTRTWLGREVDLWNDLTLVYRASCLSYFIIRKSAIINFVSETTCDSIDLTLWLVERTRANIATHTEAKVRPVKLWLILDLPAIATSQDLMDCMELQGSGCHRPNVFY